MKKNIPMIISVILLIPVLIFNPDTKPKMVLFTMLALGSLISGIMAVKVNRDYMREMEDKMKEEQENKHSSKD